MLVCDYISVIRPDRGNSEVVIMRNVSVESDPKISEATSLVKKIAIISTLFLIATSIIVWLKRNSGIRYTR